MEVATAEAGSGQETGNTGQANSLSDAISAAIQAQRGETAPEAKAAEKPPQEQSVKVEEVAGDKRVGEDAARPEVSADKAKETEAADKSGDASKTFEAPSHWPEADRKAFAALAPDAQGLIRRLAKDLEGGFTRKSQELGSKAKYAEAISSLIDDQTRQHLAHSGANELQYFQYLDRVQKFAARQPVEYLKWAMQSMGVGPEQLGFPAASQQQPGSQTPSSNAELDALLADPRVNTLEAELAKLKGAWSEHQQAQEHAARQREAWQRQQLVNTAVTFRSTLDDAGQLRYPHFDQVHAHMGALMQSDPDLSRMPDGPEKMQAAYDMAVWARPDLRQSLVEAETAKRIAIAEKAREAARAKSVTAVKPANGVATSSSKPKTLDDMIRDAMAQHGVRP